MLSSFPPLLLLGMAERRAARSDATRATVGRRSSGRTCDSERHYRSRGRPKPGDHIPHIARSQSSWQPASHQTTHPVIIFFDAHFNGVVKSVITTDDDVVSISCPLGYRTTDKPIRYADFPLVSCAGKQHKDTENYKDKGV